MLLQRKILVRKLKRGRRRKNEMKSQPKHPWRKKSFGQESKQVDSSLSKNQVLIS